jgi:putative ABC transport system substrate-binding protein
MHDDRRPDSGGAAALSRRRLIASGAALALLPAAPSRAQARPLVYMVTFRGRTEVEAGFQDYLEAHGFDVDYVERDIARDPRRLPALVDEIRALAPDLVYTWGTPVTLGIAGRWDDPPSPAHIADIPVVFALVAAPVAAGIMPDLASSGRNVTGAVHVVPLETQVRAMQSYRAFDRVGVLYSRSEQNSRAIVAELESLAPAMGFTVLARTFAEDAQGQPVADGAEDLVAGLAADGADWLYYLPDTFLGTIYDRVSPAALAAGLPTFGAAELAVRNGGALVGLVSRYYSVGQLAASKALLILRDGVPPAEIPASTLRRFALIINMATAKALGVYPPLAMLNYAEVL